MNTQEQVLIEQNFKAAETALENLFAMPSLPRSHAYIAYRLDHLPRLRQMSALISLNAMGVTRYAGANRWMSTVVVPPVQPGTADDNTWRIGPVWEPLMCSRLKVLGLPIRQQYPVLGYFLDIGLVAANGAKLDIEIDGRCHRNPDGTRKIHDIIRDARLQTDGWQVLRFWVKTELMTDFEGCVSRIVAQWEHLSGERLHQ